MKITFIIGLLALFLVACNAPSATHRDVKPATGTGGSGGGETAPETGTGSAPGTTSSTASGTGGQGGAAPATVTCEAYDTDGGTSACLEASPAACAALGWQEVPGPCPTYSELGCCVIGEERFCYYYPAYDFTTAYDLCEGIGTWEGLQ